MNLKHLGALPVLCLFSWMAAACSPPAAIAAEIQVVRISHEDRAAVIQTPEDRLTLITEGGRIPGLGKVTEISENRVVIDAPTKRGGETLIIRMENGRQRIERIRKGGDGQSLPYVPEVASGP